MIIYVLQNYNQIATSELTEKVMKGIQKAIDKRIEQAKRDERGNHNF
ncbi:hypothetical protein Solca_2717 [Solitalea canadensis DSM 3403]|uniref:Uncharacterized protein n=1 Tax=Solitalea canadensis (strain ATCC 29591 / DSM 3403 / JCM 21819 / LMG 8368 / NBRC 15130 / NCIMB 12057 / USAM 9D) TaxID=929556 RepID=H8KRW3_SOLCM|nr:hypothetical protein Solca_2717 [Solitalea canadensis DSM 3403]